MRIAAGGGTSSEIICQLLAVGLAMKRYNDLLAANPDDAAIAARLCVLRDGDAGAVPDDPAIAHRRAEDDIFAPRSASRRRVWPTSRCWSASAAMNCIRQSGCHCRFSRGDEAGRPRRKGDCCAVRVRGLASVRNGRARLRRRSGGRRHV